VNNTAFREMADYRVQHQKKIMSRALVAFGQTREGISIGRSLHSERISICGTKTTNVRCARESAQSLGTTGKCINRFELLPIGHWGRIDLVRAV
jgi:hypothetical protein